MDCVNELESIMVHNQSVKIPCGPRHRGSPMLILLLSKTLISLPSEHEIELGFFSRLQNQRSHLAEQLESERFEPCRFS